MLLTQYPATCFVLGLHAVLVTCRCNLTEHALLQRCWSFAEYVYCGAVRSCRLCFTSLALLGTRGISLRGTTPQGVTFYGVSAECTATRFKFSGNPVSCLSPWRDGTGWTVLGDRARLTLLVLRHPDESLKAVSDLHERESQCANTLRGSDTTHPAASLS